ncbi:oxidoreductase, partial [Mesorhizobium sp. M7A.F.Ca.US.002.01.1.1]
MKDLSVLIVGGGAGLGALLARMAVEAGAAKIGIIDINQDAAEAALAPAKANGLPTATA